MLAGRGIPDDELAGYAAEPKLDGWRVMAGVDADGVIVRTRHGHDITNQVPQLGLLAHLGIAAVFDGELVAGAGRSVDFYRVGPATGSRTGGRSALAFVVSDLVWLDGAELTKETYEQRRARLEQVELIAPVSVVPRWHGTEAASLLAACEEHGVEGIVLKRLGSRYFAGQRSNDWRTLETRSWLTDHAEYRHTRYRP
jgi:bifunctional non-homologous end joining protein LigD